jgi:hypothetical protein
MPNKGRDNIGKDEEEHLSGHDGGGSAQAEWAVFWSSKNIL